MNKKKVLNTFNWFLYFEDKITYIQEFIYASKMLIPTSYEYDIDYVIIQGRKSESKWTEKWEIKLKTDGTLISEKRIAIYNQI